MIAASVACGGRPLGRRAIAGVAGLSVWAATHLAHDSVTREWRAYAPVDAELAAPVQAGATDSSDPVTLWRETPATDPLDAALTGPGPRWDLRRIHHGGRHDSPRRGHVTPISTEGEAWAAYDVA